MMELAQRERQPAMDNTALCEFSSYACLMQQQYGTRLITPHAGNTDNDEPCCCNDSYCRSSGMLPTTYK